MAKLFLPSLYLSELILFWVHEVKNIFSRKDSNYNLERKKKDKLQAVRSHDFPDPLTILNSYDKINL